MKRLPHLKEETLYKRGHEILSVLYSSSSIECGSLFFMSFVSFFSAGWNSVLHFHARQPEVYAFAFTSSAWILPRIAVARALQMIPPSMPHTPASTSA